MSFNDKYLSSECGIAIYETKDKDTWVRCRERSAITQLIISIPILIIVMMFLIYYSNSSFDIYIKILGTLIFIGLIIDTFYYTKIKATLEYDRYNNAIHNLQSTGMTRAEAVSTKRLDFVAYDRARVTSSAGSMVSGITMLTLGMTVMGSLLNFLKK